MITSLDKTRNLRHHAFVIEAEAEEGIEVAQRWASEELGISAKNNPDIVVLRYGLFSVADARRVLETAASAPFAGENKVLIIAASRAYHEAQNALLKLFEEPPRNTFIFFILPSLGGLLPTLRSRVQIFDVKGFGNPSSDDGFPKPIISEAAMEFMKASKEKRSAIIKKLTSGRDEEEKRELRDEAIAILNGVEAIAYKKYGSTRPVISELLSDIQILRGYLYDRSAPVKMILEHLSLVIPASPKTASRGGLKDLL
ncbi:MAG: hypothetical protein NTU85_02665 [Candidatus Kaiserbacteria bacterium]|nr:hypothetical protein [Candidatus Kaiserbacteria bacterium]